MTTFISRQAWTGQKKQPSPLIDAAEFHPAAIIHAHTHTHAHKRRQKYVSHPVALADEEWILLSAADFSPSFSLFVFQAGTLSFPVGSLAL